MYAESVLTLFLAGAAELIIQDINNLLCKNPSHLVGVQLYNTTLEGERECVSDYRFQFIQRLTYSGFLVNV